MNHRIIRKDISAVLLATGLLAVCVLLVSTGYGSPSGAIGDNRITEYSIGDSMGVIDHEEGTVSIVAPPGADLRTLVAEFVVSNGATASVGETPQVSGVTLNDFRFPVVYSVTSASGPDKCYVVYVIDAGVSGYAGSQDSDLVSWFGAVGVALAVFICAMVYLRRTDPSSKI